MLSHAAVWQAFLMSQVREPYTAVAQATRQLSNLHATVTLLRNVLQRLRLIQRLRTLFEAPAPAGGPIRPSSPSHLHTLLSWVADKLLARCLQLHLHVCKCTSAGLQSQHQGMSMVTFDPKVARMLSLISRASPLHEACDRVPCEAPKQHGALGLLGKTRRHGKLQSATAIAAMRCPFHWHVGCFHRQ